MSPGLLHLPPPDSPGSSGPSSVVPAHRRWPAPATRHIAVLIAVVPMLLAGCSGRSSFLSGGPSVGQLKTSLAHLEYENAQMKRDVAKLRRENRQMEDRLVQQEQDNGELTARLDDARNLLRERGVDAETRAADGSRDPFDGGSGARTIPAGQNDRKRRKPPVARIPGQFSPATPYRDAEDDPENDEGMLGVPQAGPGAGSAADQVGLRDVDGLDHHSDYPGPLRWSPINRRSSDPVLRVR